VYTPEPQYEQAPARYDFAWEVKDDYSQNYYGHQESRDGYKVTGRYYVQLPDGRLQRVDYTADEYGYHPVITYEGQARYPEATQYRPAYTPAPAQYRPAPQPQQVYTRPRPAYRV
jgi:hypothetical protein